MDAEIHHGKTYTELDKFGLSLKATSSLIGSAEEIRIPLAERRVDHEIELGVVIGHEVRRVRRKHALGYVFGYCIAFDMTVRGPEFPTFRKSPDTSSVPGPWIVTADEIADPNALDLEIKVNGELRQKSNTRYLIFNVQRLIEYASAMYAASGGYHHDRHARRRRVGASRRCARRRDRPHRCDDGSRRLGVMEEHHSASGAKAAEGVPPITSDY